LRPIWLHCFGSASAQSFSPSVRPSDSPTRSSWLHHSTPRRRPARLPAGRVEAQTGTRQSHRRRQRADSGNGRRGDARCVPVARAPKRSERSPTRLLRPPPAGHAQRLPDRGPANDPAGLRGLSTPSPLQTARRASRRSCRAATGLGPTTGAESMKEADQAAAPGGCCTSSRPGHGRDAAAREWKGAYR